MSNPITLARPYAKAVFLKACEQNTVEFWLDCLKKLGESLLIKELYDLMNNPLVSDKNKVAVLLDTLDKDKNTQEVKVFLDTLSDKNRLKLLPNVFTLFNNYKKDYENKKEVEVVSAFPLAEQDKLNLIKALEARYNSKINLKTKEDQTIIGGAIVKIDDTVIDGSVIGKLKQLKEQMLA